MKKLIIACISIAVILNTLLFSPCSAAGSIPAFPGAEGGGMYATGARGASSPTIYHVTNLNDSGTGSLRDAVSQDNRVVVFDVAGTIKLEKRLSLNRKNLTILGQTAPGDGICVKGNNTFISGSNIILRYIRFRMGTPNETEELNSAQDVLNFLKTHSDPEDAFGAGSNASNFIVDHCSMSWSTDECCSVYAVKDATVQWCLIGEGLNKSIHVENGNDWQEHSYGGIIGGENMSYHHNLIANCKGRFPRVGTSATVTSYNGQADTNGLVDVRNNVMYNWGVTASYGGENGMRVNLVNNYYKEGAQTSKKNVLYEMSHKNGWGTDIALKGNVYKSISNSAKADEITADNTAFVNTSGASRYNIVEYSDSDTSHAQFIKTHPIMTTDAETAFNDVIKYAGASLSRDSVDERLASDALNGTATAGNNGLLNFPGNLLDPPTNNSPSEAWPTLTGTKKPDSDNDGIPDDWEVSHGLNKNSAADALLKNADGYFNIEAYANDIIIPADVVIADKTELNNLIADAAAYNKEDYLAASWAVFEAALADANAVSGTLYPTQEEVDAAADKLNTAINSLERDYKAPLMRKIDEAGVYVYDPKYTNVSRYELQTKLDAGHAVIDNPTAAEGEINAAIEAIDAAVDALTLVPVDTENITLADIDFNDCAVGDSLVHKKDKTDTTPYYYMATDVANGIDANITATYEKSPTDANNTTVYLHDLSEAAGSQFVLPFEKRTDGKFEVSADIYLTDFGSKMPLVTLRGEDGSIAGGIGFDGSRKFSYFDGTGYPTAANSVDGAKNTWFNLKFALDFDEMTASAYVKKAGSSDYTVLAENISVTTTASDISCLTIQTSRSNMKRWIYMDNVKASVTKSTPHEDMTSPAPRPSGGPTPTKKPSAEQSPQPDAPRIVDFTCSDSNTVVTLSGIESGVVIAAKYDGGMLVDMKSVNAADSVNGVLTIDGIEADKVFVWNSFDDISPICEAK